MRARSRVERCDEAVDVVVADRLARQERARRGHIHTVESNRHDGSPFVPVRSLTAVLRAGAKYCRRCDTGRYAGYRIVIPSALDSRTSARADRAMANSKTLIKNLKAVLKLRGVTYRELAQAVEASASRRSNATLSRGAFSLQRLDQICDAVGINLEELVHPPAPGAMLTQLSDEQERAIVSRPEAAAGGLSHRERLALPGDPLDVPDRAKAS